MNINIREGAVEDLKQLDKQIQKQVRDGIEKLRDNPSGENTSLLSKQGLKIYRLKLKNDSLNHRIFFDLNNSEVVILGVKHRDKAYTPESIKRIKSRKQ